MVRIFVQWDATDICTRVPEKFSRVHRSMCFFFAFLLPTYCLSLKATKVLSDELRLWIHSGVKAFVSFVVCRGDYLENKQKRGGIKGILNYLLMCGSFIRDDTPLVHYETLPTPLMRLHLFHFNYIRDQGVGKYSLSTNKLWIFVKY